MLLFVFRRSVMMSSPKMSGRRFGRCDGCRTTGFQRARALGIPGGENTLADAVVGGVILAFRELGGDVGSSVGGNGDADVGALIFDVADGTCDRGTIDGVAWIFQHQTIIANREGLVAD